MRKIFDGRMRNFSGKSLGFYLSNYIFMNPNQLVLNLEETKLLFVRDKKNFMADFMKIFGVEFIHFTSFHWVSSEQ